MPFSVIVGAGAEERGVHSVRGESFCLVVLRQEGRKDSGKVRLLLEGCGGFAVFGQRRNLLAERVISGAKRKRRVERGDSLFWVGPFA